MNIPCLTCIKIPVSEIQIWFWFRPDLDNWSLIQWLYYIYLYACNSAHSCPSVIRIVLVHP